MRLNTNNRVTIGFISTWSIYQGTTIDRYAHSLIQGISSAAEELNCNLLLGCGFNTNTQQNPRHSFWPVPGQDVDFVPVGPWNTDGLIIIPDDLTPSQSAYIQDLIASGFPIVFTTPEGPGPIVSVDNTLGIKLAFDHLISHGHKHIAFIAGNFGRGGDSEERLQAYRSFLKNAGFTEDPNLIAFGEHRRDGGFAAMQKILDTQAPFTAVIASNDLSCIGAVQCIKNAGIKIPTDVAVIGFDDILDARAMSPSLTTIRHPTFTLGYQAAVTLMEYIQQKQSGIQKVVVAPSLIIRQSCGCRPAEKGFTFPLPMEKSTPDNQFQELSHRMALVTLIESHNSLLIDLEQESKHLLNALVKSLQEDNIEIALEHIELLSNWTEKHDEDMHIWQPSLSLLYQKSNILQNIVPICDQDRIISLLDRVGLEISDQIQRQTTRRLLEYMEMTSQMGLMTAELLTAMNIPDTAQILLQHLPKIGIRNTLAVLYKDSQDEPISDGIVLLSAGLPNCEEGCHFDPRKFPLPDIYDQENPLQLTILPMDLDQSQKGFVAFQARNPEFCAAIVHNLSAALRTSQLYQDAIKGRNLAEEANRLKSRFLSMVSHELRTPLSLIIGLSEMILQDEKEKPSMDQAKTNDLEQINTSAQHLSNLIGDVLDLASVEAGRLRILSERVNMSEVLQPSIKIGRELAREKGLKWTEHYPKDGPMVLGDCTRLRQVIINLINNAVKFTPQGQVDISVIVENSEVIVAVSDTGIGISSAEIDLVFNEFYRSKLAVEGGFGGLGLGLAISKQLIEKHRGYFEVNSPGKLGTGTTFSFRLPILTAENLTNDQELLPVVDNCILLLLNDGDHSSDLVISRLHDQGFSSKILYNKEEDLDKWISTSKPPFPRAIILGNQTALNDSWSTIRKLKCHPKLADIPVLAYTLDVNQNKGETVELNYLYKPLNNEALVQKLISDSSSSEFPRKILIIDDDPQILSMHARMVKQTGCEVLTASNGLNAFKILEKVQADLILLDLMMPVMDGFEFMQKIKEREKLRDIPIIILTARVLSEADLEQCNQGVAAILGKGLFNTEETLNHIEAALAHQSGLGRVTQQLVRQAMIFIQANYMKSISREDIANAVNISPDYLTDCFRQELGITPITYIRRYRIHQACELLRTSNSSVTEIALNVGFSDCAHFSRTFQREMGVSPRAFRNAKSV